MNDTKMSLTGSAKNATLSQHSGKPAAGFEKVLAKVPLEKQVELIRELLNQPQDLPKKNK